MQAFDWKPPESYPALLMNVDGKLVLSFPDFGSMLPVASEIAVLTLARAWVRRQLRERAASQRLAPFASNPDKLDGPVILVPTDGWNNPVEAEVEDGDE